MIKISPFSGMFPKISDKLLPNENATLAEQCDLESGSLRPARGLRQEVNLGAGLGSVFRTPEGDWMRWPVDGVSAVVSPINDDQYRRVYWTGDGHPKMASHDMAFGGGQAPAAFYPLGIPAPSGAPAATGPALNCMSPDDFFYGVTAGMSDMDFVLYAYDLFLAEPSPDTGRVNYWVDRINDAADPVSRNNFVLPYLAGAREINAAQAALWGTTIEERQSVIDAVERVMGQSGYTEDDVRQAANAVINP